jgi:phenylalanyl-tRNA synthetase beta chain
MKISLDWLKEYVEVDLPLPQLLDRMTMIGLVAERWEEQENDTVLDVETYANRPDTLGHMGIAREIAAMLERPMKEQPWPLTELTVKTSELVDVQILDEELCPRYCGIIVKGVNVSPSPDWLARRIEAMGLKSINNVVDITNYVLFATAQPIHAFDLAKIAGPRIVIRRAKKGESIRTLEGKDAALSSEMLVIADDKRPVAVAGVIGGEESAVSATTQDVFIESAYFDPVSVRKTGKALGLQTDACYRFERGADISFAPKAALMAASLLTQFGGKVTKDGVDIYPRPRKNKEIILRSRRAADLLGVDVGEEFIEKILLLLGFTLKPNQKGTWRVQVPFWRVDIEREADLVEEIARFYGYDKIPIAVPPLEVLEPVPSHKEKIRKLCQQMFHRGFDEVINLSFVDPDQEAVIASGKIAVEIRNPISAKASRLRTTLLGGLLENTAWNKNRGIEGVHIFEVGNIYFWMDSAACEEQCLGLSTTGPLDTPHWKEKALETDIFHLKGACEAMMEALRYEPFSFEEKDHPFFEEGFSLALVYKGEIIGHLGLVRKRILDQYSIDGRLYAAEIGIQVLFDKQPKPFEFIPLPKFPCVSRDLSFLVDRIVPYQEIKRAIEKISVPHLETFDLIDDYAGESIPGDKKSLSLRFIYRNPKATLLAEDVDKSEAKIIKHLQSAFQVQLRERGGQN